MLMKLTPTVHYYKTCALYSILPNDFVKILRLKDNFYRSCIFSVQQFDKQLLKSVRHILRKS